jgi:hypothetical protein
MITQDDIDTVLGQACANLGYPVTNAAFWRDTVPQEITDEMVEAECAKVRASLVPIVNPIALAEAWIGKFFTDKQLLKMAIWIQQKGQSAGPKLEATYAWEETINVQAIQGATTFAEPEFTFEEVAIEVLTPPPAA